MYFILKLNGLFQTELEPFFIFILGFSEEEYSQYLIVRKISRYKKKALKTLNRQPTFSRFLPTQNLIVQNVVTFCLSCSKVLSTLKNIILF